MYQKLSKRVFVRVMSTDTTSEVPTEFDLNAIDAYLKSTGHSDDNRTKCMRVIVKLVSGRGVTHDNKSGVFLQGHCVTPHDDLEALRVQAQEWLPKHLDGGNGYALTHPIGKLIKYKNHLLGIEAKGTSAPPKKRKRENPVAKALRQLKGLYDDGVITSEDFESKKVEVLGRI